MILTDIAGALLLFIAFFFREDAQNAIDQVNGHGYDHLILQVDWAEDRKPAEGGK